MAEFVSCGFVRSYVLLATLKQNSIHLYDWLVDNITKDLAVELPTEKKE